MVTPWVVLAWVVLRPGISGAGSQQRGVEADGEGVVAVPARRMAGLAEPAPVMGDDLVAASSRAGTCLSPGAAAERVAADQHHGWSAP